MSASTEHGSKLPRKAEQAIAAQHEPATRIDGIGPALAAGTYVMISPIGGPTLAAGPEAQRKFIETVQHLQGVAAVEGKRGTQGTQPK